MMEHTGVPIDMETLARLRTHWEEIKAGLIGKVNEDFDVFVPTAGKKINPATEFGQAVLDTAAECGLEPQDLLEAVGDLWRQEYEIRRDALAAKRAARVAGHRVDRGENSPMGRPRRQGLFLLATSGRTSPRTSGDAPGTRHRLWLRDGRWC